MFETERPELNYFHDLQIIARELDLDEEQVQTLSNLDAPSRREFVAMAAAAGIGLAVPSSARKENGLKSLEAWIRNAGAKASSEAAETIRISLVVNGAKRVVDVDPRTVLLDALRERMALTGTKKGCDHGQCGACTVLVDGRRVLSCLTLAAQVEGQNVTTIEGLAQGDELHPMQEAFIRHDAFQCGYCTPGQICSAVGMLEEAKHGTVSHVTEDVRKNPHLSPEEIRERMSGNICRCGAYPKIVSAIEEVHSGKVAQQTWGYHKEAEIDTL